MRHPVKGDKIPARPHDARPQAQRQAQLVRLGAQEFPQAAVRPDEARRLRSFFGKA